ncbi:MAG: heparinase II/III family protein [Bacteroidales bacterium]|nr:heparinase II/III family protein [Bacteroidales bacterium]
MRRLAYILTALALFMQILSCSRDPVNDDPEGNNQEGSSDHPCLMLKAGEEAKIKALIDASPEMMTVHKKVISQANSALKLGPSQYKLSGGDLLNVSRQSLMNLFSLAYTYRMTGVSAYLDGAVAELKAVCSFKDWNPDHYLDTGEMALGVSIAYDWLYDRLPDEVRTLCETALRNFALKTGLSSASNGQWFKTVSNWNQVCSAGLAFSAMATRSIDPELSGKMMDMVEKSMPEVLADYSPDGTYKEGPMYWAYGTGFHAVLNFALSTDGKSPFVNDGFRKTGWYYVHSIGPTGKSFNYCDANSSVALDVTEFYFAQLLKDPGVLFHEWRMLGESIPNHRLLPAILVFLKDYHPGTPPAPSGKTFCGGGATPVYYARTSWDSDAAWFGIKGGKAHQSHAHMDQGSFVYDAHGYRWARDLGNVNYANAQGSVNLWVFTQTSTRWNILAYQNLYHNTLTLDGAFQNVEGKAEIIDIVDDESRQGVTIDLTPCYFNVSSVTRKACLLSDGTLEITDKVTPTREMPFMWTMVLESGVNASVESGSSILLSKGGKVVKVSVTSKAGTPAASAGKWNCQATSSYETTSATCVGFTSTIPAGKESEYVVTIKP